MNGVPTVPGALRRSTAPLLLAAAALLAPAARADGGLEYFKNYFVTGDALVSGVQLQHQGVNGFATGQVTVDPAQIPAGAEIVAAYLYWQTIYRGAAPAPSALSGAKFKKNDIRGSTVLLGPASASPCWDDDGGKDSRSVYTYRADVLRFFPRIRPADTTRPVQVLVGGAHEVTLPDGGKRLPTTLGAGLVVVYRVTGYDPASGYNAPKQPLRSIVIFDKSGAQDVPGRPLTATLEGFYEASRAAPHAKLSLLLSTGATGDRDDDHRGDKKRRDDGQSWRVLLSSTLSPADSALVGTSPSGSGAGFGAVTFGSVPLEPGAMKALVTIDAGKDRGCSCLTWGAAVLSTEVQDSDGDGLVDAWEERAEWEELSRTVPACASASLGSVYPSWPLTDPTGVPLPDLQAMGASRGVQDLFVQIDYLTGTGHTHLPSKAALFAVANAFHGAAPRAARASGPIAVHFDIGAPPPGWSVAACGATWAPDCAIVPAPLAKGGHAIPESVCSDPAKCAFPASNVPGIVGWKNGFRAYRDPRFARNRKDIFHYALFAHALGYPSPTDPAQPRKTSGISDVSGGDLMVTLGLWTNQVGSDFVQAATLMHELGHNLGLRHGGISSSGGLEPNCRPNYQSVMNYLFQVAGLLTPDGTPVIDFSRQALPAVNESRLVEASGLGATDYLARWYAPKSTSFIDQALNTTPASRHCDGTPLGPLDTTPYVRVDADPRRLASATPDALDWNGDGTIATAALAPLDINFDGMLDSFDPGSNDFATMDLRQVGGRRSIGSQSMSQSVVDPVTGLAPATPIGGGLSLDARPEDLGYGDLGYGDLGIPADEPLGSGDLDLETAGTLASNPTALTATVVKSGKGDDGSRKQRRHDDDDDDCSKLSVLLTWQAPNVSGAIGYQVYRVAGAGVTPDNLAKKVLVANLRTGQFTSATDTGIKKRGTYTYFVVATVKAPGGAGTVQSGPSNFATVTL